MSHIVKCFFCGQSFDRDKEPTEKIGARRYAHKSCAIGQDQALKEERDKNIFYETVKSIYGTQYNYIMINKQATDYINQYGYTWSGMTGCLHWFYNINHGSLEEGHGGIGIIPYIYDTVKEYYQKLYTAQEKNKDKKIVREPVYFKIQSPKVYRQPPHLLDMGE